MNVFRRMIRKLLGRKPLLDPEERLTRYLCYRSIRHWIRSTKRVVSGKVLCVSGVPPFVESEKNQMELTSTEYPAVDIQALPFSESQFDWVIADQVLEHVENPRKAADEMRRVLKPGGIAIFAAPSLNREHDSPRDFWRIMPAGMRDLCKDFTVIHQCRSWGSARAVNYLTRFTNLWEIPEGYIGFSGEVRSMADDEDPLWPIVTWIIAEK